jgi:N-acetylneuraminic acid mutarotase
MRTTTGSTSWGTMARLHSNLPIHAAPFCYFEGVIRRLDSMKKHFLLFLLLAMDGFLFAADPNVEPLPEPLSNNAVAILKIKGQLELFSMMGIGAKKTWDAVSNSAYELDADSGKVYSIHAVPGTTGRLGAMAVGAANHVYLMGGYVLYQGGGMAVPDVGKYETEHDRWFRQSDMPIPVGEAVIGVYRDRFIYLVGGRSNTGPVTDVQMYDLDKNRWSKATPIATAVFGHAGALVGNTIVYVDGAVRSSEGSSPRFVATDECWSGKISHHDPTKIEWTKLPSHPGTARFRIAAGDSEKDEKVYFFGGSDKPHDDAGIGYDGSPAEPVPVTFAFNLHNGKWETLDENTPNPTMDHRGLLVTKSNLVIIGGMEKGQVVTAKMTALSKEAKAKPAATVSTAP